MGYLINKTGYNADNIRIGIDDLGQRILDDSGIVEGYDDASESYRDITKSIFDSASMVLLA